MFVNAKDVSLTSLDIRYASTAIAFEGNVATISGSTVEHSSLGLLVTQGAVSYRGTFVSNARDIQSCDWGGSCGVDAAYTYWGSVAGPPSGTPAPVCGTVTTSPWYTVAYGAGATASGPVFGGGNCDGSRTPDQELASAVSAANAAEGHEQIRCGEGFKEACEVIALYQKCFSAALNAAQGKSSFDVVDKPSNAASTLGDFLSTSAKPAVSSFGETLGSIGTILGAVNSLLSVRDAYNQCF